ncbi:MAG: hypothetical protein L0Z50_37175 [Verrucomicrobiales bacterium]|nr:hypothetical protein [Verrucomicrobiales bacterium]
MSTLKEIKEAIGALSAQERAELERWLRQDSAEFSGQPGLPDQAARRRRILGDQVLPNLVLEARHSEPR